MSNRYFCVLNKTMRFCFKLVAMAVVASSVRAATADPPPRRVATVVRADTRSGRLVRSVAIAARVVPEKAISPAAPGAATKPPSGASVSDLVTHIAGRHDVEPLLVDSVIRVESNYNPYAISPKGAMGLMQLIPGTARRFGVSDTFEPEQNIEGGVRYLKYLMQLYNGDERLALAAYNAGEGAVAKYRGIPPYPETQNYVYQVGKRLGQSREAEKTAAEKKAKAAKPDLKPEVHAPVIEKTVDGEGREYYRTR
jgi:soluble lytic murein transglycosylase-like protein